MGKPDFMLIGASRSGTSSMFLNLIQHPKILKPRWKEAHYFDNKFNKPPRWYDGHFPDTADGELTFDATPNYLYHRQCPKRIFVFGEKHGLQLKFIVMLRNPVDRTWSHFEHCKQKVGVRELSFAVTDRNPFVIKSVYIDQILRWREYFDRDRFLFVRSEDFYRDPRGVCGAVFQWLGLEPAALSKIKYWDPWKLSDPMKHSKYKPCPPEIRRRLKRLFEPHNRRLYEYMQFDFGWETEGNK